MRCLKFALACCCLLWLSSPSFSAGFGADYYALYQKPGSGGSYTLYLVPKLSILIVASDVNIPIAFMPEVPSMNATLASNGTVGAFTLTSPRYTVNDMAALGATLSNYKLFGADFNGDGLQDLLLQGTGARESLVFQSDANGNLTKYYSFGTTLNSASVQVSVSDLDGNGRADVLALQNGVRTAYLSNSFVATFDTYNNWNESGGGQSLSFNVTLVGSVNGKFRVDEKGASNYSLEILSARGTAGVAPHISLNYSSGSDGDGIAGVGWSIGGLSGITRCNRNPAQDAGQHGAISFTAQDRFCLDGQRLVLISGTYGGDGATYRTEIDSYALVTSLGGTAANPDRFIVQRKDGSSTFYGSSGDAKLMAGTNTLTWYISRFEDSVGNPIRFSYVSDAGGHRINRIDYAYGADSGYTPRDTYIDFIYEDRTDPRSGYVAGNELFRKKRLAKIRSFSSGAELRNYNFIYHSASTIRPQSNIEKIYECVGTDCLSPTTFSWAESQTGFQGGSTALNVGGTSASGFLPIDINGDGKTDMAYVEPTKSGSTTTYRMAYALSNGSGFNAAVVMGTGIVSSVDTTNWQVLDYNNDGYQDLMLGNTGGNWKVYLGSSSGFNGVVDTLVPYVANAKVLDFNGDGMPDIAYLVNNTLHYRLMERQQSDGRWTYTFGGDNPLSLPITLPDIHPLSQVLSLTVLPTTADFNGDGVPDPVVGASIKLHVERDFLVHDNLYFWVNVFSSTPQGGFSQGRWVLINSLQVQSCGGCQSNSSGFYYPYLSVGDLNGDGLADICAGPCLFNSGDGFFGPFAAGTGSDTIGSSFADYNGDGYMDLIYPSGSTLLVKLYDPITKGMAAPINTGIPYNANSQYQFRFDVDGDGRSEIIRTEFIAGGGSAVYVYKPNNAGRLIGAISGIDNGMGGSTSITYKPLTDGSVYTRDMDANNVAWSLPTGQSTRGKPFPVSDMVAPYSVVQSVSTTAPAAGALPGNVNQSAQITTSYRYGGAKWESSGRGFLGFRTIVARDLRSVTTTTYRQDFPYIGQPLSVAVTATPTSSVIKAETQNHASSIERTGIDGSKYFQVYTDNVVEISRDPASGAETSYRVTAVAAPDEWGNIAGTEQTPGIVVSTYASSQSNIYLTRKETVNSYGSPGYDRQFGRLSSSTVRHKRNGCDPACADVVRTSSFTYLASGKLKGLLESEVVSAAGAVSASTHYDYDQFGNKTQVTQGGDGAESRFVRTLYDQVTGRYPLDTSSQFVAAYGSATSWEDKVVEHVGTDKRNAYGQPLEVSSELNALKKYFQYDKLGRESLRSDDTGAGVTTSYAVGGLIPGSAYQVSSTAVGTSAVTTEYYDKLGRSIGSSRTGFDGRLILTETEYDALGRVKRKSAPHYNGAMVSWTEYLYDEFGRMTEQQVPASGGATASTKFYYDGLYAKSVNALGQNHEEWRNAAGDLIRVKDNLGGSTLYSYDATGQLASTLNIDSDSPDTKLRSFLAYDGLGRKIKLIDADKGTWFYRYNVFGELSDQFKVMTAPDYGVEPDPLKAAHNYGGSLDNALADPGVTMQRIHTDYDRRGRMVVRKDFRDKNATDIEGSTFWTYDVAANGKGQPASESGGGLTRNYAYDGLGRLNGTASFVNGTPVVQSLTYDGLGRLKKQFDGASISSGVENGYNAFGYLAVVSDLEETGVLVYQIQEMDARGNVIRSKSGNNAISQWNFDERSGLLLGQDVVAGSHTLQKLSYAWDLLGNQTSRFDQGLISVQLNTYRNLQQLFCYDGLNRLVKTYSPGQGSGCGSAQDQEYDAFGNITFKVGVGTYAYMSDRPRALLSTTDAANNVVSYIYDATGNMLSDTSGRTLHYTVFDKPDLMKKASSSVAFSYDASRAIYKRVDSEGGESTTTYTVGSVEKVVKSDGSYDLRRYLPGGALWTLHMTAAGMQSGGVEKQTLYRDALGSVVLIADETSASNQPFAFDSWGQRVSTTDWQTVLPSTTFLPVSNQDTNQGFTGHEMVDAIGLVHMQGRIYDPRLGRFVQADPVVQDPLDTQAYNRYSYVLNSPLSKIDPTGFMSSPDDPVNSCSIVCINISGGTNGGGKWRISGSASYNQPIDSRFSMAPVDWSPFDLGRNSFSFTGFSEAMSDSSYSSTQGLGVADTQSVVFRFSTNMTSPLTGGNFANGASTDSFWLAQDSTGKYADPSYYKEYTDYKVGVLAANAANVALRTVLATTYPSPGAAALAWSSAVRKVSDQYDTEIGSKLFKVDGGYRVGSATSDGVICSKGGCSVNVQFGGEVDGGYQVGVVHTHPSNALFSDNDIRNTVLDATSFKRDQSAYVSLKNGEVWTWSAKSYNKSLPVWGDYNKFSKKVER